MTGTANIEAFDLPVDKGSKMLKKAKSLSGSLTEVNNRLHADFVISTNEEKTAARLQKIAEGLVAFGMMAEPDLEELNIKHGSSVTGNQVSMHLTIPVEEALAILGKIK